MILRTSVDLQVGANYVGLADTGSALPDFYRNFPLLMVLAWTPFVQGWIPFIEFFHVALVVHVTLSVHIWLLSISAAMWSLGSNSEKRLWDKASFLLASLGTAIVIIAPFAGVGNPLLSNYIPVLQHPLLQLEK